ncbi:MAG TPA: tripartite tricarboxylate transporter TctB family protein [Alphaproteobacteria bacterium]
MKQNEEPVAGGRTVVTVRTMEIVVCIALLVLSAIVIQDSLRVGAGWAEDEGPRAGYFPFYIGIIMALASLVTLVRMIMQGVQERRAHPADATGRRRIPGRPDAAPFVTDVALKRVLLVLIPVIVYVAVLLFIGIYVASAIYIALFMMYFGRYRPVTAAAIGIAVAVAMFLMFEVWFLVPLPKGPLEEMFGF